MKILFEDVQEMLFEVAQPGTYNVKDPTTFDPLTDILFNNGLGMSNNIFYAAIRIRRNSGVEGFSYEDAKYVLYYDLKVSNYLLDGGYLLFSCKTNKEDAAVEFAKSIESKLNKKLGTKADFKLVVVAMKQPVNKPYMLTIARI